MKLPLILPALVLPALLAPALHAQGTPLDDLSGNVSPFNLNLTVRETIGGINPVQAQRFLNRGFTLPDVITYDAVFSPGSAAPNVRNPYGWDISRGNNYVERQSNTLNNLGRQVTTVVGTHRINTSRYNNRSLLQDLVTAGRIPSINGYRLVAVRFTPGDFEKIYQTLEHATVVNSGLYFFAERGPNDPAPIFLGAENDVYDYDQFIDFETYETADAGNYTDIFTGRPAEEGGGFAYELAAENYNGVSLAEFSVYRPGPAPDTSFYEMRVGGIFNWRESYNARRGIFVRGPIAGRGLSGPANTYLATDTDDDTIPDSFEPSGLNEGVVNGIITMPAARQFDNLQRYLDQLPPVLNN